MIAAIERSVARGYGEQMRSLLLRLLASIAVLLMPLGMSVTRASAHHGGTRGAMPMQHCPGQGSRSDAKGGFAECTMACSAALPAAYFPTEQLPRIVCLPAIPATAQTLHGLHPDTATPPPKIF